MFGLKKYKDTKTKNFKYNKDKKKSSDKKSYVKKELGNNKDKK